MRAFILRRVELIAHGLGDVVLVGSNHCAGTLRVKEFLTRNGHPYAYVDLDRDADVQDLLDRFHVGCRRRAGADLPRRDSAAESDQSADRRLPRLQRGDRPDADPRRGHRRRRAGRARGGRVRRVGGARCPGAGVQRARRTGRLELEDRELPRFPNRHLGSGARGARVHAGAEVRRPGDDREGRHKPRLRPEAVRH